MRIIVFFCFVAILSYQATNAQYHGYYHYKIKNEKCTEYIEICIYKDNNYAIVFNSIKECIWGRQGISYGTMDLEQDKIIFNDYESGCQIICSYKDFAIPDYLECAGMKLTVEKSFIKQLTGLSFVRNFCDDRDNLEFKDDNPFKSKFDKSLTEAKREESYNNSTLIDLKYGEYNLIELYSGEYKNISFELLIYPNNKCKLKYYHWESMQEIILFEGIWERTGNVLTLFDVSTDCPFYLLISEKGLIPNQMFYPIHKSQEIFRYGKIKKEPLQKEKSSTERDLYDKNSKLFDYKIDEDEIFMFVDEMPLFKGDESYEEFKKYVSSHTIYPIEAQQKGISGRVYVGFVIDVDGSVIDAKVIRGVHPLLDKRFWNSSYISFSCRSGLLF